MTTTTKTITENYRHPKTFGGTGIRYFVSKAGMHVVVRDLPAGEDIAPMVWRFDRIEEARVQWKKVRETIKTEGYERKS
jgi:hypothetical protein